MNNILFSKYYHEDLNSLYKQIVPQGATYEKVSAKGTNKKYDYIILQNTLAQVPDIQHFVKKLKVSCHFKSRVVVIYFNFLWKPIIDLATILGLRRKDDVEPSWLTQEDIRNFFNLEGFEEVKKGRRFIIPINLGPISDFINRFLAPLPLVNSLCLTTYQVFRPRPKAGDYSISIIIPARNEEGNMLGVLKKIPKIGKETEVIFVEGNSKDNTYQVIKNEVANNKNQHIKAYSYKQKGKGKGDAVRLGFQKARNDIVTILDADLTVDPKELVKFYRVLAEGYGDFANGSRLVYPMGKQAMRTLNYLGNKLFSVIFTFLLGQPVKDTLCGTKTLFRSDYQRIANNRKFFGDFDPFGDFDLLFGATKLNLKIVEVPIRYKDRTYGTTNISRFRHGLLLLKMTLFAAQKLKFT